jgi:hypothetical protein
MKLGVGAGGDDALGEDRIELHGKLSLLRRSRRRV